MHPLVTIVLSRTVRVCNSLHISVHMAVVVYGFDMHDKHNNTVVLSTIYIRSVQYQEQPTPPSPSSRNFQTKLGPRAVSSSG